MPKGISINIGVREARASCCGEETLDGPENDAHEMARIAERLGFGTITVLVGTDATFRKVEHAVLDAASALVGSDTLLLTYSGHGCQIFDPRERDKYSETWCLFDREVRDDHIHEWLTRFAEGVRIIIVADSCHSGGGVRVLLDGTQVEVNEDELPEFIAARNERRQRMQGFEPDPHCDSPDTIRNLRLPLTESELDIKASVLYLASCREGEKARDGRQFGLYTRELSKLWADGEFKGTYIEFIRELHDRVSKENTLQHPGWACDGARDNHLLHSAPFAI